MSELGSSATHAKQRSLLALIAVAVVFLLQLAALPQSLWYDELYTILHYIGKPWATIVTGEYAPNNHVLFTLIAKFFNDTGTALGAFVPLGQAGEATFLRDELTLRFRLPAMIAGALAIIALARPARRQSSLVPYLSLILLAALQPWLFAQSIETRGYTLMLFFTILATDQLSTLHIRRSALIYACAMVGALYTIPLAVPVLIAHGCTVAFLFRPAIKRWLVLFALIVALSLLLYSPYLAGVSGYARKMATASTAWPAFHDFILSIVRHLCLGADFTTGLFPTLGLGLFVMATAILGLRWAWQLLPDYRPHILTFAGSSLLVILAAAFYPPLRLPRFCLWPIPLFVIAATGCIVFIAARHRGIAHSLLALLLIASSLSIYRIAVTPAQPWQEAIRFVKSHGGDDVQLLAAHTGAYEAVILYFLDSPQQLMPRAIFKSADLDAALRQSARDTWLTIAYESTFAATSPEVHARVHEHFEHVHTFPGRVSNVSVFRIRRAPLVPANP